MRKCSLRRKPMKMALGFNWGDLTLQTYRTTTVRSQLLIIRFVNHVVFNKLIRVECMLYKYIHSTLISQLVHNVLSHIKVNLFNNFEGQYWKETVIHYVMALGLFKSLPIWIHIARCYGSSISAFYLQSKWFLHGWQTTVLCTYSF
jgi:hypothetical protein